MAKGVKELKPKEKVPEVIKVVKPVVETVSIGSPKAATSFFKNALVSNSWPEISGFSCKYPLVSFTYSSRGSVEGWYSTFLQFYFRNGFGITKRIFKDYRKVNVSPNC